MVPRALAADTPNFEAQVVRDVAYREVHDGEDATKGKNKLDLYLPKEQKDYPVIFFVHGGAWRRGDKNFFGIYHTLGTYWARHGIGMVVTNYRLSPPAKHPDHIKDVAQAFAWTYKNIQKYGGQPDEIFVCGHSAGGHLVALLATDETYLKAEGLSFQAIKGAIPISGVYRVHDLQIEAGLAANRGDGGTVTSNVQVRVTSFSSVFGSDPVMRKAASPLTHVKAGLPPFLVVYADRDLPTLPDMAREFDQALKKKSSEIQILEVKRRDHFSILLNISRENDPVERAMREFIAKQTAKP
jgi:acetyl esterase/lipase